MSFFAVFIAFTMQFGLGIMSERGKLNLGPRENYCMGGPGMILSRETLVRTAPHVDYCVNNLLSTHEDVEVGRCITRFTGATCTRALGQVCISSNSIKCC